MKKQPHYLSLKTFLRSRLFTLTAAASFAHYALDATASAVTPEASLSYYYNGKPVELKVDATRVAARAASAAASAAKDNSISARASASAASVSVTSVQSLGVNGWTLVPVTPGGPLDPGVSLSAKTGQATSAATRMAAHPGVEFAAPVLTDSTGLMLVPTAEILIKYATDADPTKVLASFGNVGITSQEQIGTSGIWKLKTNLRDGAAVMALANSLNAKPGVAFAEPNFIQQVKPSQAALSPLDPLFGQCWGLRNTGQNGGRFGFDVGATSAWNVTTGRSSVLVVVIDDGIQQNHPDINQIPGLDFTSDFLPGGNPNPANSVANHGTACAGIIAGITRNGIGGCGIAPGVRVTSAKIAIPYTGLDSNGKSKVFWTIQKDWLLAALNWSGLIGARVTSNSYTYGSPSAATDSAFATAKSKGIVNFASSGNDNASSVNYPARNASVVAVGAADHFGNRCSFSDWGSNWGAELAFMAPGESIVTTDRTGSIGYSFNDYTTSFGGTSAACPFAAGIAALLISQNPTWTPDQVAFRMKFTCTDIGAAGYDTATGFGMLNAARALGPVWPDDHGNVFDTATPVALGSRTGGTLTSSDVDMFRFNLTTSTKVDIKSSGTTDVVAYLYDVNFNQLAFDDDGAGIPNFRIVTTLPPGNYYLKVKGYDSGVAGNYSLMVYRYNPIVIGF